MIAFNSYITFQLSCSSLAIPYIVLQNDKNVHKKAENSSSPWYPFYIPSDHYKNNALMSTIINNIHDISRIPL